MYSLTTLMFLKIVLIYCLWLYVFLIIFKLALGRTNHKIQTFSLFLMEKYKSRSCTFYSEQQILTILYFTISERKKTV